MPEKNTIYTSTAPIQISPKKPTIAEVAKLAGVSTMTVSRVINGSGSVSAKRKALVESAIKALNYQPNMAARHLSSSRSNLVGLLYDNPSQHYVSQFLLGALMQCRTLGQHLVVEEYNTQETDFEAVISSLLIESNIEGLILLPPLCDCAPLLQSLKEKDLAFVRIAPDRQLNCAPCVCMDDYAAAFELTEKLIALGHRDIGFIKGSAKQGASRLRLHGFLDALRSHQLDIPEKWIQAGDFSYKSGLVAAENLLNSKQGPTAIFASNDDMAAATLAVAHKLSLNTPGDLSVVGFDDTDIATSIWPQLTTIKQPIFDMAQQAIKLLEASISAKLYGNAIQAERVVMPYQLVCRQSTQALKSS